LLPRPTCELYSQCPAQCYRQKRRCHQEPAQRCANRVGNVVKPEKEGRGVGEGEREEKRMGRRMVRAGHFKKGDGHYEALESDPCRLEYCRENCRVRDPATPSSLPGLAGKASPPTTCPNAPSSHPSPVLPVPKILKLATHMKGNSSDTPGTPFLRKGLQGWGGRPWKSSQ
jgi:hypothetical protein